MNYSQERFIRALRELGTTAARLNLSEGYPYLPELSLADDSSQTSAEDETTQIARQIINLAIHWEREGLNVPETIIAILVNRAKQNSNSSTSG